VGSGFTSYSWTPISLTTITVAVSPTTATTYTLLAGTSTVGCNYTAIKTVSVNPNPTISVVDTHPGGQRCPGFTYTVYALGASTYTWNTSAITSSIVVSPTVPTSYSVTGTSTAGCLSVNTATSYPYTMLAKPTVSLNSTFSTMCTSSTGGSTIGLIGTPAGGVYSGVSVTGSTFNAPATAGTYTTVYTYTNSTTTCTNSATKTITVAVCTGLEELSLNGKINIYPNPNNGEFTLIVPESGNYSIINSIGQTIKTIEVKEDAQTISINGLADGIYYVVGKASKAKIVVSK
jgi:hypothetical protein